MQLDTLSLQAEQGLPACARYPVEERREGHPVWLAEDYV